MRVEATLPDARGQQLDDAARELGLSRSEIISEALAVFLTSLSEARRGFRLAFVNATEPQIVRELVTPALAQLSWHAHREKAVLADGAALATALASDAEPTPELRKLVSRRRRK